jgi:hypothetical protein
MDKPFSRQPKLTRAYYYPAHPGHRAVFLAEARSRKEMRQIRELFDTVGQLAEVVPVSHGTVMSYAVQVESDTSLFGKIEWLLKTQFAFSLVERSFSEVTFRLVQSLCEDAETQMAELPECGACGTADPFPTRVTVEREGETEPVHLAYCSRCAARCADEDPKKALRDLMKRDRRKLRVPADLSVVLMPDMVEDKPEWQQPEVLAATG